jgi:hypothetical protein
MCYTYYCIIYTILLNQSEKATCYMVPTIWHSREKQRCRYKKKFSGFRDWDP